MEKDSLLHGIVQERFEDVEDDVENVRLVHDVEGMDSYRKGSLRKILQLMTHLNNTIIKNMPKSCQNFQFHLNFALYSQETKIYFLNTAII